jgi:hypothetical protein
VKHTKELLAAAGVFVVTGAMGTVQADTTLYTSAIHTGVIACNAINVSKKTLNITISIIDVTMPSPPLAGPTLIHTPPGVEATIDFGSPTDSNEGYCVFQVSGTGNRDDVRAVQNAVLAGTRTIDGTTFPLFITRVLEAR